MILRDVAPGDDAVLASFDPGSGTSWLDDPAERAFDRRVVVAEDGGQIVAVAAHERVEHERAGVLAGHRYLMVVAVRRDRQRTGLARLLAEAVVAEMQLDGVQSFSRLIHPANTASYAFSRSVFPDADDSSPPEDDPYVRFVLGL